MKTVQFIVPLVRSHQYKSVISAELFLYQLLALRRNFKFDLFPFLSEQSELDARAIKRLATKAFYNKTSLHTYSLKPLRETPEPHFSLLFFKFSVLRTEKCDLILKFVRCLVNNWVPQTWNNRICCSHPSNNLICHRTLAFFFAFLTGLERRGRLVRYVIETFPPVENTYFIYLFIYE